MKIEILGTGCPKCRKLTELVTETVNEMAIAAEIVKVDRINDIMNYGVMITPALVVDGKVVVAGKLPSKDEIRKWLDQGEDKKRIVREGYARVAKESGSCCCGPSSSCCGGGSAKDISKKIGYSDKDLSVVPEGANLGLGCGNPLALASLKAGETVLDLGSGAGLDCFLAADRVGNGGRVIGVDMTPEMIQKATENAKKSGYKNVELRLGDIEKLPVEDNSIDVIISNCVINLSPDKESVFKEAFRVLKPGGRVLLSDIVLLKELPQAVKQSPDAYVGCVSGAILKDEYLRLMKIAGFAEVKVVEETAAGIEHMTDTLDDNAGLITSAKISGVKPAK